MENYTIISTPVSTTHSPQNVPKHLTIEQQIIITACYVIGILGNLLALVFLCRKGTRPSNPKYKLMLKCLSVNDLTALTGMLVLMYIQLYLPVGQNIWYCRARVVWRVFGLGSGCVAIVMAVERWLALTKPFVYQKHVTVVLIRRSIFGLWISAVVLACMPFFGFGLYYEGKQCVRYRNATKPLDVAYAYLYFAIGMLLCICIAACNIAVMRSLCFKGTQNKIREPVLMRRMSRSVSKMSNASTREEIAFGRLMGFLCVIFILCWMPQMMTIPMTQMNPHSTECGPFFRTADILMALHFLLDPYVYVLQRLPTIRKLFCSTNRLHNSQYKSPSIRTSSYDTSFYLTKI